MNENGTKSDMDTSEIWGKIQFSHIENYFTKLTYIIIFEDLARTKNNFMMT